MRRRGRTEARRIEAELAQRQPKTAKPDLTRRAGEKDGDYFRRILPKPPRAEAFDDGVVEVWMTRCMEVGGPRALEWLWLVENWPLGPVARGRAFHVYGRLMREAEERGKREAERAARQQQERRAAEEHEAKRRSGWA